MEAVVVSTRDTPYRWLSACDANMEPGVFVLEKWFGESGTIIRVPAANISNCRSKGADDVETPANV